MPQPPAQRRRMTLYPQPETLEQACRRAHEFAARFPVLYRWRLTLQATALLLFPFFWLAFMGLVTVIFPAAFRESEFLHPLYAEPFLRWLLLGAVYASWIPMAGLYLAGVLRALVLPLPQPEGTRVSEAEAPRLFRVLKDMARSLNVPPPDEVLLSPEHVLYVSRLPQGRAGILRAGHVTLVLGLPLLEELSPQQLRALLAHELAHLATHGRRFGGRVLALRERLAALASAAEASALTRDYWTRLPDEACLDMVDGIVRRLTAMTFPAARQHETEADAIAAAIAGRDFAASALLRQRIAASTFGRQFRDDCMRMAQDMPAPPADLFDRRAELAAGKLSEAQIHTWLRAEMDHKDDLAQSHPPLWDRLRMMGYALEGLDDFRALMEQSQPHCELGETAARFFLGDTAERLRGEFFAEWARLQSSDWRARFETYESLRNTAAGWNPAATSSMDDVADMWQIAVAVGNTRNWRDALPLAQRILEIQPEHGDANLLTGQLMLEDGDAVGLEALERAMAAMPNAIPAACATAARFLDSRTNAEAAAVYRRRADEHREAEELLAEERRHVRATDAFVPAESCPAAVVSALRQVLDRHASHVRAAYLMRKRVAGDEGRPVYVLGIERRTFLHEKATLSDRLLLERITREAGLPRGVAVCVGSRANRRLLEKWRAVTGSLLWPVMEQTLCAPAPVAPPLLRSTSASAGRTAHAPLPSPATPAPTK